MKRLLFLLAVTAAAIAVPSTALAARGVALTKDQARHAVVVATKSGAVRTVRAPGRSARSAQVTGSSTRPDGFRTAPFAPARCTPPAASPARPFAASSSATSAACTGC
jgi:hypothetical protein